MSASVANTLRSLDRDGRHRPALTFGLAALLALWTAWLALARVGVYEAAANSRLEVHQAAHSVASPVGGRVVRSFLAVGREVQAGDALVELDGQPLRHEIDERLARLDSLEKQADALRTVRQTEEAGLDLLAQAGASGDAESTALTAKAQADVKYAQYKVALGQRLHGRSAIAEEELLRDRLALEAHEATLQSLRAGADRRQRDRAAEVNNARVRVATLSSAVTRLETEQGQERAALARLRYELEQRTIRAPVSGRLGEVTEIRPGSVLQAAQPVATVVPPGAARAVAYFPAVVVGKLAPGQPARLRLDGFPWTQYGTLPAAVADVGSEAHQGLIRVELTLQPRPDSAIPVQHGLTGTTEVEVERVAPAVLVLRAAGQWLHGRRVEPARGEGLQP